MGTDLKPVVRNADQPELAYRGHHVARDTTCLMQQGLGAGTGWASRKVLEGVWLGSRTELRMVLEVKS